MSPVREVEIAIIGAGVSGLGAAMRLTDAGEHDFVILEKAGDLGGTWRDNTYPGCACDVPSSLYSYSFAQKPDWSRVFATQPEILAYVRDTAARRGVLGAIRFHEPVDDARWDESMTRWRLRTPAGETRARFVISCAGYLHEPQIPAISGLASFDGRSFHSSRWDHEHSLRGERVAVIGTGASAIQFVPRIAREVAALHVYQRTPQWILPKPDAAMGAVSQRMLAIPGALEAFRAGLYTAFEAVGTGFRHPALLHRAEAIARAHLARAVRDPSLRAKLTPDYVLGCKRVLLSNDYYPALTAPNVELHATGVVSVDGRDVVGADGRRRTVDTIIFGTGFHVSDPPIASVVHGVDGRSLEQVWAGSPEAYRGTTISGFPNAFIVLGPNLAIGHNSAFVVIEAQLDYVLGALRAMRERGAQRIEVRRDVQRDYNARISAALEGTVWNTGGCSSYYLDANGRNSIGFPYSTYEMRRMLGTFDAESYHLASTPGLAREASHAARFTGS